MSKRFDFEYIIVGGGIAGTTAALKIAKTGRKVALVEQDKWGGAGLATRDIPGKTLLNFSHLYARAVSGNRFGISSQDLRYNYQSAMHWREKAIERAMPKKQDLENSGITCIKGRAHFIGNYDLAVGDQKISANKFLIATGSEPADSGISGLDTVPFLTPATALATERLPKTVMIIGGGPTGCELAQYYAELGAQVVILELSDRLLPKEDAEVGQLIGQYLAKRLGVKIFTQTRAAALEKDKLGTRVIFMKNGQERAVRVGTVVLATGSKPAIDFGLNNAGVSFDKGGLVVDRTLQTSARNIFAAGDVIGGESSTERAIYSAEIAVLNMLGRSKTFINFDGFMRVIDTDPQVAVVGMTEDELVKRSKKYKKVIVPLSAVQASIIEDDKIGFLKIMADHQGKILGAVAVCPDAAAVLQEISLAIRHNLPLVQVASAPHVASSWTNLVQFAAKQLSAKK